MAGLLAIAVSLPIAVKEYAAAGRSVTVKGFCEQEVKADRAIWPIVLKEGGNNLTSLAPAVEHKTRIVTDWLERGGLSSEEFSVCAPKVENLMAAGYEHRTCDYAMTSVITVCSSNVDKVLELQANQFELLGKGIAIGSNSWEYPAVYEFTRLNEIKPGMIEQATQNARESAEKFAKDSGSRLGVILKASQGQVTVTDRDQNTPYIKTVRVVTTVNYKLK